MLDWPIDIHLINIDILQVVGAMNPLPRMKQTNKQTPKTNFCHYFRQQPYWDTHQATWLQQLHQVIKTGLYH